MRKIIAYAVILAVLPLLLGAAPAATEKPAGATAVITVDAAKNLKKLQTELFGQNVNVYENSGHGQDEDYNAAVRAMGTNLMRFPGGGYSEFTDWENYASGTHSWLPIDLEKGIEFARKTGCQLQICVNMDGVWGDKKHDLKESVDKAARWVKHMNVKPKALYCKWWEVGNENFKMMDYGERFVEYYKAMKKVDPSIKIGAQVQFDHQEFSIKALQAIRKGGVVPDFFIVHAYPIWFPVPGRELKNAPDWDKNLYAANPFQDFRLLDFAGSYPPDYKQKLDKLVSENLGPQYVDKIPYWMTEYRSVLEYKYVEYVDTLFCAQFILEMGRLGWQGANLWALKNGFATKTNVDFGLLRTGQNGGYAEDNPANSPRPTYYVFPYLSKVFGRQLVQCDYPKYAPVTEAGNKVRAWASKDEKGNLTVLVVNNDPENKATATVNVAGFAGETQGRRWTFESAGTTLEQTDTPILQRRDIQINGVRRPTIASLPGAGETIAVGPSFKVELPVASMVLVMVPKKGALAADLPKGELKPGEVVVEGARAEERKKIRGPAPSGPDTQVMLQDFSGDEEGAYSTWQDPKGSRIEFKVLKAPTNDDKGNKDFQVIYKKVEGGWCGAFCRAGSDWDGVDVSWAKSVLVRVLAKQPVKFGLAMEDEDKKKFEVVVPVEKAGAWETVTVPVTADTGDLGKVMGFNVYLDSVGEGEFTIDWIKVVKPADAKAAETSGGVGSTPLAKVEGLTGGEVVLEDFSVEESGTVSAWKDEKGSVMEFEYKGTKKKSDPEDMMLVLNFRQIPGGWCGLWSRAGKDWNGLDCTGGKAVEVKVFASRPMEFGVSLSDETEKKIELSVPVGKSNEWQTVQVPLSGAPAGFGKGVKGFNFFMKSPGKGTLAIDHVKVLK